MSLLPHIKWKMTGVALKSLMSSPKTGVLNCARGNANADIEHLAGACRVARQRLEVLGHLFEGSIT